MAIRIRCTGCKKKISMDDAFAGGTCRCPYCKEIVLVGGRPAESVGDRPYAPVDRPEAPDEAAPSRESEAEAAPVEAREVPMANPVRIQGVVTIVLMGLIVVMAAVAVWLGVALSQRGLADANLPPAGAGGGEDNRPAVSGGVGSSAAPTPTPTATPTATANPTPAVRNPFVAPGEAPDVAGVQITGPVLYVLDAGGSMKDLFDYARYMARVSIRSLGPGQKFNLVLSAEEGEKFLGADFRPGGREGDAGVKEFLLSEPRGTVNIGKTLEAAIARGPRTIVLFRRSAVDGAKEIADKAKTANVVIVAIGLASDSDAKDSLTVLSGTTGGQCRTFSESALANWVDKAPPLE